MINFFSCSRCHGEFSIVQGYSEKECPFCHCKKLIFIRSSERTRKTKDYTKPSDTLPPQQECLE